MSLIDVENLLKDISAEDPCGLDLEYDTEFGEIERSAQGKPEQQVGDSVIPKQEADWASVKKLTLSIFGRTKDLRLAVHLTRSLLQLEGFVGLNEGLALIKGLLERYWDNVHPQLDPDDNNDPTIRINTLSTLSDPESMLQAIRESILLVSPVFGRISFRDILIANGKLTLSSNSDEKIIDIATIDGAFMDADVEVLQATADAISQSIESANLIESLTMDKVGSMQMLDFSGLSNLLKEVQKIMNEQLGRRGVVDSEVSKNAEEDIPTVSSTESAIAISGQINSREDVIKALDMACKYFKQHEPSSPVPLLLERAKRLVTMDFMDILRDLTPAGVTQAEEIGGTASSK